jgi:hypothetical protein
LGFAATGLEINPAAFVLSRTYRQINRAPNQRERSLTEADRVLEDVLLPRGGLFAASGTGGDEDVKHKLIDTVSACDGDVRGLVETVIVLADFFHGVDVEKAHRIWNRVRSLVRGLPYSHAPIVALHQDCRGEVARQREFDLVLTSPPYINVYNYHQQYRASTEALGWDLLSVARSEIGSNRKHRGNRFLTVVQYCLDIAECLVSLSRITTRPARMIFVVGRESNVRGVSFHNGELVARLAVEALGMNILLRQERVFTNRFGQRIYEDIVHLTKNAVPAKGYELAVREIARDTLLRALVPNQAPEVAANLKEAIEKGDAVMPSPLLRRAGCRQSATGEK